MAIFNFDKKIIFCHPSAEGKEINISTARKKKFCLHEKDTQVPGQSEAHTHFGYILKKNCCGYGSKNI